MNLRSTLAIARKDALDIILNKTTLFTLLTPFFIALLYALFLVVFSQHNTEILVYNPGNSQVERAVSSYFNKAKVTHVNSSQEVTAAFGPDGSHKDSPYAAGLIIPDNFEQQIVQGQKPEVTLYMNNDQGAGSQERGALASIITAYVTTLKDPHPLDLKMAMINPPKSEIAVEDILQSMFGALGLLMSFITGISVVSSLLVEEKEKKTLRMLMVSPATFTDVIMAKLLVGLGYQLLLSIVVALTLQTLTGNVPLLLVFILLGSCLALSVGLLAGCIFQTNNAVGVFNGVGSMFFFVPGFFAGGIMGSLLQNTPATQVMKFVPTYYLSDGIFKALNNQGWNASILLDAGILLGSIAALFVLAAWLLRRQASVVALI